MATEHQFISRPETHTGVLADELNQAAADGWAVQQVTPASGSLHVLLTRETTKDDGAK